MASTCEQCGRNRSGRGERSVIGRTLCSRCSRQVQTAAAGAVAGAEVGTGAVPTAIATVGWRERVRTALGRTPD